MPQTLADHEAPMRKVVKDRAACSVPVKLTHQLSADMPALAGRVANAVHVASAPATRDLTIDFLRGIAVMAVAVGHWLVVVPSFSNGHFDGVNALATVPLMRWLSWIFQVMPLFFIVGGFANGISWRTARAKGVAYAEWLRTRLVRLVKPTTALLIGWMVVGIALRVAGVDPAFVHKIAWLVVVPLWFLAVYVIVVALAPAMLAVYERCGVVSLVALAALATMVDYVRLSTTIQGIEHTNFLWVFLFCQQLGFFWLDGRLRARRWQPIAMFAGGLMALVALTQFGPYPLSMVGVPGERIANNAPPTITLIALGIAQAGLGLMLRPLLARLIERRRVAGAVLFLNVNAMTILLWHFTALVVAALVILPLGVVPTFEDGSGAFWLVRLASLVLYLVPLAGLLAVFGRIERAGIRPVPAAGRAADPYDDRPGRWRRTFVMLVATGLLAAAFLVITVRGLSDPGSTLGIPFVAAALFASGVALLPGNNPRSPSELVANL